jgi:hypothetical protein
MEGGPQVVAIDRYTFKDVLMEVTFFYLCYHHHITLKKLISGSQYEKMGIFWSNGLHAANLL